MSIPNFVPELVLLGCGLLTLYGYALYPLLLMLLPARRYPPLPPPPPLQRISVIIAAHNEATKIKAKLDNTLALDTTGFDCEILVASDASTDATDDIVRSYVDLGVILARAEQRLGKEHAQKLAIARSTGEVIVFTDAATLLEPQALQHIAQRFTDARIGAVSSIDRVISADGKVEGEGLYVRYEMWLRDLETRYNTLVGLSGSLFAARRVACERWDVEVCSDFCVALNCAQLGLRAVSDRNLVGYYRNLANPNGEYRRKVRTILRGMHGLVFRREVLKPSRYGRFAFQVFSHKVMRWTVPWLLLTAEGAALVLALDYSLIHVIPFELITGLLLLPILVRWFPVLRRVSLLRLGAFFVEVNLAILHATLKLLAGQDIRTWEPSKR